MTPVRFAAVQMSSGDDVAGNLRAASELLGRAADNGAVLAVLPENFACIGVHDADRLKIAEREGSGPVQDFLADAASRAGLWIVGGTFPLASDDPERPYSACLVFDGSGRRVGRYDKIHLFDVGIPGSRERYRESNHTRAGSAPLVLDTPWGRLGVAVCYDLRFPEMFRVLSEDGMEIAALPAAFTSVTGRAHWRPLLRARAIENLCYVVAAAQVGMHPGGRQTHGHSMIVEPWGDILAEKTAMAGDEQIGCISAEIDRDRLRKLRDQFPAPSHRRFGLTRPA